MQILLTGSTEPDRKIHFIKAIRAATGLGLKESKHIADTVLGFPARRDFVNDEYITVPAIEGHPMTIDADAGKLTMLVDNGVQFEFMGTTEPDTVMRLRIVQEFLYECPRHITVQDALDVLVSFKTGAVS